MINIKKYLKNMGWMKQNDKYDYKEIAIDIFVITSIIAAIIIFNDYVLK